MGIIRSTFTFWLIAGIVAAVAVTIIMPTLKDHGVEKIPGREEALKLVRNAKNAIKNLPDKLPENPLKTTKNALPEPAARKLEPLTSENDSIKERDARLFKRQCSILDDLI